ncbi:MAG: universal stress protein [Halanaeroarchaeum sp.]
MDRALVVVDDSEAHRDLLREAGELASGVGADLVLLSMMTEEEFDESYEAIEKIADIEQTKYDRSTVVEGAEQAARNVAKDVLEGMDVEYEAVGAVVEEGAFADRVLRTSEEYDCDHVFITGRRRSPTGKAIFGDTAQAVILNFDGPVTVITA